MEDGPKINKNPVEVIDEPYFESIPSIPVLKDIEPDPAILEETKQRFFTGEIDTVELTYQKNKDKWYDEVEVRLLDLKNEITVRNDMPEVAINAYIWAVNERLAKVRMLRELQLSQKEGENKEQHMQRFSRYSEYIYGSPDQNIFNNVMYVLGKKLANAPHTETSTESYGRLLGLLGNWQASTGTFTDIQNKFTGDSGSDEEIPLTNAEELKKIFEEAVVELGLEGLQVVIDEKGTRRNIAITPKKLLLPNSEQLAKRSKAQQLTKEKIAGLIKHELGVHAVRSNNAKESSFRLLRLGLDRYEVGEEGFATYEEESVKTESGDYAGFENYFAAGLAKGLDGGGEKDFAQTHQILTDYYQVIDGISQVKAKELAWNRCMRIFRGTTGDVPGVIFTKDIIYRKGNIAHYEFMSQDGSEKLDLRVGKFDPANPRHWVVLKELKILTHKDS